MQNSGKETIQLRDNTGPRSRCFFDWQGAFLVGPEMAGGKGWNLGRLDRYGFPVPPGGVLSTDAYRDFLNGNDLHETLSALSRDIELGKIGEEEPELQLQKLRAQIKEGIIPAHVRQEMVHGLKLLGLIDKALAVRSSASVEDSEKASFAGVHDSFLNITGLDSVYEAVKDCYASLWTLRAVSYRLRMGFRHDEVHAAVIIMEMIRASAAGVAFSCNPQNARGGEMLINANLGLGESVVMGLSEPDEYRLSMQFPMPLIKHKKIGRKERISIPRESGGTELIETRDHTLLSHQGYGKPYDQALPDGEILKLGLLIQRVLAALGKGERHQDVEWVFDGERLFLVQARPLTVLPHRTYQFLRQQPEIWSNANLRDAAPMVLSILTRDTYQRVTEKLIRAPFQETGYKLMPGIQYVRFFQGRAYLNISAQQWEYFDAFGTTPAEYNAVAGGHQPEIQISREDILRGKPFWRKSLRKLLLIRAAWLVKKRSDREFAKIRHVVDRYRCKDLSGIDNMGIIRILSELQSSFENTIPIIMLLFSSFGLPFQTLLRILKADFPGRESAIANALLIGCGGITSAEHGYRLYQMAVLASEEPAAREFFLSAPFDAGSWESQLPGDSRFREEFRRFLQDFGHRGVYEADLMNPRWREDPTYLLEYVRGMLDGADSKRWSTEQKEKKDKVKGEIEVQVPLLRRIAIKWLARMACKGAELREMGKSEMIRMAEPFRYFALGIGKRFVESTIINEPEDVFHCTWLELASILLGYWDGIGLKVLVLERKQEYAEYESLSPPDLIVSERPHFAPPAPILAGKSIRGMGVAAGRATGSVRIISHPNEGDQLLRGEVLVAQSTDPAWTPLFLKASAIVMETGGIVSHGAIVAREYGIPAVVNIPGILGILKNGQKITVDGDEGLIYLEEC